MPRLKGGEDRAREKKRETKGRERIVTHATQPAGCASCPATRL